MYLHLFEDFSFIQTHSSPTTDDIECVDAGILDIFKWDPIEEQFMYLNGVGEWQAVPKENKK